MTTAKSANTLLERITAYCESAKPTSHHAPQELLREAHAEIVRLTRWSDDIYNRRNAAEAAADRIAYALFDVDQIGEHTNLNDPWQNAAELIESSPMLKLALAYDAVTKSIAQHGPDIHMRQLQSEAAAAIRAALGERQPNEAQE